MTEKVVAPPPRKIGSRTDTRTVYIGSNRFKLLNDVAINVSFEGGRQVTASQVLQYLVDNFTENAKEQILKEIKES